MKQKLLLFLFIGSLTASADAQRRGQKEQKTTAYAITAAQKGSSSWTEVRLVDVNTGEVLKTIYGNKDEVPTLNARTRKPVAKKEAVNKDLHAFRVATNPTSTDLLPSKRDVTTYTFEKKITIDAKDRPTTELQRTKRDVTAYTIDAPRLIEVRDVRDRANTVITTQRVLINRSSELLDKPFSTTSAACAYDKKHERLYYTPMGINELRYIDLKAKTPTIYYFENEPFGALSSRHDVQNQITRMVIAGDGNGYALTNSAKHLIRFTTDKKANITDLGSLTNDPANGRYSIHSTGGGGDLVADEKNNLYLIAANRAVFKISLETQVASYVGSIKGLPRDFSTNGAVVDKGTSIVVSSANSTLGYFRFDLEDLVAERISPEGPVYNASDLANGNLLSVKKKKETKEEPVAVVEEKTTAPVASEAQRTDVVDMLQQNKISVYPNPIAMGGVLRVSFKDQPQGTYTMQFMDIAGKLISSRQVNISSKQQVEEYALPELTARGNYLLKVVSETKQVVGINKVVVQ
jgi:hypothetical protein